MSYTSTLAQVLLYALICTTFPTVAMHQTSPRLCRDKPNHAVAPDELRQVDQTSPRPTKKLFSEALAVNLPTLSPNQKRMVWAQVEIEVPESVCTQEERLAHFYMRGPEIEESLRCVLRAYLAKAQRDIEILTVIPTRLYFNPDDNTFIIKESLGVAQLTQNCTVLLEKRIVCSLDPAQQTLQVMPLAISIIEQEGSKRTFSISEKMLHELYPLAKTSDAAHTLYKEYISLGNLTHCKSKEIVIISENQWEAQEDTPYHKDKMLSPFCAFLCNKTSLYQLDHIQYTNNKDDDVL